MWPIQGSAIAYLRWPDLPDLNGPLSSIVCIFLISSANTKVCEALEIIEEKEIHSSPIIDTSSDQFDQVND